jgi:acyl carrier protein
VLGVEVPRMGTLVKAAVVMGGGLREADVRAYCRQRLAFYKVPRLIEAVPSLPRSAVGKVLKSELASVEPYLNRIRSAESARMIAQLPMASPARRRVMLAALVQQQASAVLGQPVGAVPRSVGFTELGMDSFASIELRARLEYLFGAELAETFTFDHPTVDAIVENLMDLLAAGLEAAPIERT